MKRSMGLGLLAVVLLSSVAGAQESRVYTRPAPLSREALDRMHLKQAWRVIVPVLERRDGIYSVQFLGDQIIVQTRAGVVISINAADGTTQWKKSVGIAHRVAHPVGYNSENVFVARGTYIHAINRKTGTQVWEYDLPSSPSCPPTADEESLYVSTGLGRLQVYDLPKKKITKPGEKPAETPAETNERKALEGKPSSPYGVRGMSMTAVGPYSSARTSGSGMIVGPQPELLWEFRSDARIEQAPILTDNLMVVVGTDGTFLVSSKFQRHIPFQFKASSGLAAPPGDYRWRTEDGGMEETVFVASKDFNLFCLDVTRGKILWRFTGAAPIHRKPEVTDEDVYLVADRAGLYRINRTTGQVVWRNTKCEQYLASNKKFVYATDRSGRLLVLDRVKGTEQASLDTSAYTVPISNELTDRIYLASTDGQLICLYDRDNPKPLVTKTIPPPKPPAEKPMGEGEKKADEKKPEKEEGGDEKKMEKKDKDKEKDKEKEKEKDN